MLHKQAYYKAQRNKYLPKHIKLIFILESPPASDRFFYNSKASVNEPLFKAFMSTLFNKMPSTRAEGLAWFQEAGYLVVDAIYRPVNKVSERTAALRILHNYSHLVRDLKAFTNGRVPLILVKKNIRHLLEDKLVSDGFWVLNNGVSIPFPIHYHFVEFRSTIQLLLNEIV